LDLGHHSLTRTHTPFGGLRQIAHHAIPDGTGTVSVFISLAVIAGLILAVALLARRTPDNDARESCYGSDATFIETFSIRTYKPMLRLAGQMDSDYLVRKRGKALASCYSKIKRDLLREYLREASKDFNRMYRIANDRCVQARSDPDNMSAALLDEQLSFLFTVWVIEAKLLLGDLLPFQTDLRPMLAHLEAVAAETRMLIRPVSGYSYSSS
jgi:hypothetical protein